MTADIPQPGLLLSPDLTFNVASPTTISLLCHKWAGRCQTDFLPHGLRFFFFFWKLKCEFLPFYVYPTDFLNWKQKISHCCWLQLLQRAHVSSMNVHKYRPFPINLLDIMQRKTVRWNLNQKMIKWLQDFWFPMDLYASIIGSFFFFKFIYNFYIPLSSNINALFNV